MTSSAPLLIAFEAPIKLMIGFVNREAKVMAIEVDKNNNNVTHAISILQKTISLEFKPPIPNILPIIPVNPQIRMVK